MKTLYTEWRINMTLCVYLTEKLSAIDTEFSIHMNLLFLKQFELFLSENMINNDQITLLLYCCNGIKSHRSEVDTVPLSLEQ